MLCNSVRPATAGIACYLMWHHVFKQTFFWDGMTQNVNTEGIVVIVLVVQLGLHIIELNKEPIYL